MRGPDGQFWSSTKFTRLAADGTPMRKEVLLDAGQLGGIPNQFDEALAWDGTHWGWFALKAYDFPAGAWRLVQKPIGYEHILVNGVETFTDGKCTGATPGHLLRFGNAA